MIAIEIRVNGELIATCGDAQLSQLVAMLAVRKTSSQEPMCDSKSKFVIECMGVRPKDSELNEVLRWLNTQIECGDEVSFKIVETDKAQDPFDSQEISAHAPNG